MYDGPQSPALAVAHIAVQNPLAALCVGLAVGTYLYVTPATELPVQLPSGVEATRLYDGLTGQYMTLADLAKENLDPDTYVAHKGTTKRCYVTEGPNGSCICEEIPQTK